MIDQRLIENSEQQKNQEKLQIEAQGYIDRLDNKKEIYAAVPNWWKECIEIVNKNATDISADEITSEFIYFVIDKFSLPSTYLKSQIPLMDQDLTCAFDISIKRNNDEFKPEEKIIEAASIVLSKTAGKQIACAKSQLLLTFFLKYYTGYLNSVRFFTEEFCIECASSEEIKSFWVSEFQEIPNRISYSDNMNYEIENWETINNPFSVWHRQPYFGRMDSDNYIKLDMLKKLDHSVWQETFETFPLPDFHQFLIWGFEKDPDQILVELKTANSILDDNHDWNRSLLAVYATKQIFEYAEKLHYAIKRRIEVKRQTHKMHQKENDLDKFMVEELPQWFEKAYRILLSRQDGKVLAIELYAELIHKQLHGRSDHEEYNSFLEVSINALNQSLIESGIEYDDIKAQWKIHEKWVSKRKNNWNDGWKEETSKGKKFLKADGLRFLLASLMLVEEQEKKDKGVSEDTLWLETFESPERIWSWIEELLVGRDTSFFSMFHDPNAKSREIVEYHLGRVLISLNDPAESWKHAWDLLYPQRQKIIRYDEFASGSDQSAKMLVHIAFGSISHYIQNQDSFESEVTVEIWKAVLSGIRSMYLMQSIDTGYTWRKIYILAITYLGIQFKNGHALIDEAIQFISNDDSLAKDVTKAMTINGWNEEAVIELIQRNCSQLLT